MNEEISVFPVCPNYSLWALDENQGGSLRIGLDDTGRSPSPACPYVEIDRALGEVRLRWIVQKYPLTVREERFFLMSRGEYARDLDGVARYQSRWALGLPLDLEELLRASECDHEDLERGLSEYEQEEEAE